MFRRLLYSKEENYIEKRLIEGFDMEKPQTVFGADLELLARCQKQHVPKIVVQLTRYLTKRGMFFIIDN